MLAHLSCRSARSGSARSCLTCPPDDVYAFGGWLSWFIQAKMKLPSRLTKPIVSFPSTWSSTRCGRCLASTRSGARKTTAGCSAATVLGEAAPCRAPLVRRCPSAQSSPAAARTPVAALHVPPADADYDDAVVPRARRASSSAGATTRCSSRMSTHTTPSSKRGRRRASSGRSSKRRTRWRWSRRGGYKTEHVDRPLRKCPEWVA